MMSNYQIAHDVRGNYRPKLVQSRRVNDIVRCDAMNLYVVVCEFKLWGTNQAVERVPDNAILHRRDTDGTSAVVVRVRSLEIYGNEVHRDSPCWGSINRSWLYSESDDLK